MTWPGAALFRSADGGSSYASVFSESTGQVIGTTSTALGPHLGGNTFDEANTVTVVVRDGALSSVSELAVLNGSNTCVIGAEILQYKNAVLTATNTYVLSGLLRGRRGTEWAMIHGIGERFVVLPVPRVASSELNVSRQFKPVTFGANVALAEAQNFTNTGNALKPYAPVLLGGGTDGSSDVTLNWTLRTRTGGAWLPFIDVTQADSTDCIVQIWNADYTQCARIMPVSGSTTTYTSAQQVTDFGANQQTIYFTVGQLGAIGIGTQARGTAVGAGASNGDPLSPVSPYQSPTSGSSGPPPDPNVITVPIVWTTSGINRVFTASHGAFACGAVVAFTFTTGSTAVNNPSAAQLGRLSGGNTVDGPVTRTACLSTVAGDFTGTVLGANSFEITSSPFFPFSVGTNTFGYPELSTSTTYYLNVKNDDGHGVCTCTTSDCAMYMDLLRPQGT